MEHLATPAGGGVCRGDGRFVNSELLASRLRSIGHETFAEYYRELSGHSRSNEALIEVPIADKGYTLNSARTKVSVGRGIIRAGRGLDALRLIADAKNKRAMVYALAQLRAMEE